MKRQDRLTKLIQHHNVIDYFNYNYAVEWAMNLLERGNNHETVLMLASFAEPVNTLDDIEEIKPFVSKTLKALGLDERNNLDKDLRSCIEFYIHEIINKRNIRDSISNLNQLYSFDSSDENLLPFYELDNEWYDLENDDEDYCGYYYPDVTLDTIEEAAIKEAKLWLQNNFNPEQ